MQIPQSTKSLLLLCCVFCLSANVFSQPDEQDVSLKEARQLLHQADSLLKLKEFPAAEALCFEARLLFETTEGENSPGVADALCMLGETLYPRRKLDLAIRAYKEALQIRQGLLPKHHPDVVFCYSRLGSCFQDQGDFDRAIEQYFQLQDILIEKHGKEHEKLTTVYRSLGACYISKGDFQNAFRYFEQGYAIQRKLPNDPDNLEIRLLNNMGVARQNQGDIDQALLYYQKMLAAANERVEDDYIRFLKATAYLNIGDAYLLKEEPATAMSYFESAVEWYGPQSRSTGLTYGSMTAAARQLGMLTEGRNYLQMWKDNWEATMPEGHPYYSRYYYQGGLLETELGDFEEGIKMLQKALELNLDNYGGYNPEVSKSYLALGSAWLSNGDHDQAQSQFNYALIASGGEAPGSDCSNPEFLVEGYQGIGDVYMSRFAQQQKPAYLKLALANFEKGLEVLQCHQAGFYSDASKFRLSEKSYPVLEKSLSCLYQLHQLEGKEVYLEQAWDLLEQSRSIRLFESLQETEALHFAGIPESLLQKENQLRIDLTFLEKQQRALQQQGIPERDSGYLQLGSKMLDLQQEYETLRKQFEADFSDYYQLKYDLNTISLPAIRSELLEEDQTLVEFLTGNQNLYVFAVQKERVAFVQIPLDFDLETYIEQMRHGIYGYYSTPNKTDALLEETVKEYVESAQFLYQRILGPVQDFLRGDLIIVPDGALGYLPFEALLTAAPRDIINFSKYPYFYKEHAISYNYSATLIREMQDKTHHREPEKEWLGFAPFFDGGYDFVEQQSLAIAAEIDETYEKGLSLRTRKFSQLPNSGEEMVLGKSLWNGDYYLGADATRDRFRELAGQYRMLHLSTHGVADPRVGDYSYLAFAEIPDSVNNELLYVRDLYNLRLNADLVVLSACETGIGEVQKGEGIISLSRAFAYAGAKSILTSLWVVDDASTKDLIKAFYLQLKKGENLQQALFKARKEYIRQNPGMEAHPFFWAGFIIIG
ncbi:MAG: CHAT domain-containing protein [Bacteroidetes bacterium]|nr:CHAT domain-containing protein [Bacteroidota bacterium]